VALSPPKKLIGMSVWSLPKLRDYLQEQKMKLSRLSWEFDRRPGNVRPRLCDSLLAVNCIP
jgi:hypothetical protein